jgi:predicted DsbA family dithiol-disulfide isomerase
LLGSALGLSFFLSGVLEALCATFFSSKAMYHAIFVEYRKLKSNEDLPVEIAQRLGLDLEKFKADANDPEIDAQIQKEFDQMRNSGIPRLSVPKFLVAGKEPQGRDLATFSRMIDEALKN